VSWNSSLLTTLRALLSQCEAVDDATDTLTLHSRDGDVGELSQTVAALAAAGVRPRILLDNSPVELDEVSQGGRWTLTAAKASLITAFGFTPASNEVVVLFFSPAAFDRWACRQTALKEGFRWPDRLTILVDSLSGHVAGPKLRCGNLEQDLPAFDTQAATIEPKVVSALVQIALEASNRQIGQAFITQGNLEHAEFACLLRWSERDAARLLCDEVAYRSDRFQVTLRGARRVSMVLDEPAIAPTKQEVELLQSSVVWCFAEHRDARHALLIDRLALDGKEDASFITYLRDNLKAALQDARDRYRLVVLEKKDAATKETREIMKDVRAQADAYAAKVRDLTSTFLRDLVAALLLVGFGLLGKINSEALGQLINAKAVNVFFCVLSGYFVLWATLQIATHWRDLTLTTRELRNWWFLTRSSLPGEEVKRVLDDVITPRRRMFFTALWVVALSNLAIAIALWNWKLLLAMVAPQP